MDRVACVVVGRCDCVRAVNGISAAGCESLSGALRVNSTLTSLDVSRECDCDCATGVVLLTLCTAMAAAVLWTEWLVSLWVAVIV
jgi:hypothetical protein